jgi:RNA-directed DNA polymerase
MRKAPISLQDLRRRLYIKAKTEPTWRFWGLYVHVCKQEPDGTNGCRKLQITRCC